MAIPQPQTSKPAAPKEEALDDALADSFPASDPISPGAPHRSVVADEEHLADHVASHEDDKERNKSS
ncbi:MAG TPA: hypothetical protein VGV37_13785 [Aliidongia sp.]|uniref:hypothetical protein n=1 Tax=Aliidongia sp. TaxID=1914230 RepID=UPI002DDDBC1A|nr:hypothetical protein [Aliidongia sp.]HEV2675610.1 hypothetical protein [Aliidongia sp.]